MIVSITFDDVSPVYLSVADLRNLINFLNEVNVVCTFFVVPYGDEPSYSTWHDEFTSYLREAAKSGHELALHGYKHAKNEFGCFYPIPLPVPYPGFKKQRDLLKKGTYFMQNILGVKPLGFRAPYYLYNNITLKALSSLGFYYDSSATIFKPAHSIRLRVRWLRRYKPFKKYNVVEIPVCGDYTYSLETRKFAEFLSAAIRDFELIKSVGGVFVINNHPQRFKNVGFRFLRVLFKKLSTMAYFSKLCDVAKMYR